MFYSSLVFAEDRALRRGVYLCWDQCIHCTFCNFRFSSSNIIYGALCVPLL